MKVEEPNLDFLYMDGTGLDKQKIFHGSGIGTSC